MQLAWADGRISNEVDFMVMQNQMAAWAQPLPFYFEDTVEKVLAIGTYERVRKGVELYDFDHHYGPMCASEQQCDIMLSCAGTHMVLTV